MSDLFQTFKPQPDRSNLVDVNADPAEPPLLHRSYSQVSGFLTCAMRYRLERRENLRHPPTWSLVGGKCFHLFSEELDACRHDPEDWPAFLAEYVENEEASTATRSAKWTAANKGKEDRAWWTAEGEAMAYKYVTYSDQRIKSCDKYEVELGVEFSVKSVKVVGYIDRLLSHHGVTTVIDLKTGKMKTVNKLQYAMYEYGLRQLRPDIETVVHEQYHARTGEPIPVRIENRDLAYVEWIVQKMDLADRLDMHLPSPGNFCSACSVKAHCPAV